MRTNLFYIVFSVIFLTIGTSTLYSQDLKKKSPPIPSKNKKITIVSTEKKVLKPLDTIKIDSSKTKKPFLESIVKYKAVDYAKINQKKKLITLYNKAELYYTDVELKSGIIVLNYQKNEVYAGRLKDSVGKYTQFPNFKQGASVVEPDSIRFNFKTKKALVWNSRTEQGDFKVKAALSKRENDSVYFMKGARFTTSKDIEDPEYWFQTNRLKFVPGKKIVTGTTNLVIEGVPTPLILPFAFFPMGKEVRNSGIIIPTFADNSQRGYSLQNGGYYFALSDNYDLAILGDYYTSGGYAMRFQSNYAQRYKFKGNLNFRFENQISGERGFAGYAKTNIYNLQWSHSKDSKSNPNSSFSASVNLGSSKYYQQSLNQTNNANRINNNLSSSVSYTKRFNTIPQVNLSLTATHSQNTQTAIINMTLPTLLLNVDRIFPFAPKDGVKKGFIKNINFQYNLSGKNQIATTDEFFFTSKMFNDAKIAMQHSIPISTNFKVFKYFSATTNVNYEENWVLNTIRRSFDLNQNIVVDKQVNGFDAFRKYSLGASLGTVFYGTFNFGDNKKIQSIRHVVTPGVSYSYTPSFKKYYDTYAIDASGKLADYTRFENGVYGAPGKNYSNNLGFSINNTFEAKVKNRDSTKTEPKKIMLLNNLNLSSSYDITADSLRWSPVRVSGSTQIFNQKMNVNVGATLNPYAIDYTGKVINKFNINNGGSLFRLTSANLTLNYSLKSKDKKETKKEVGKPETNFGNPNDLNDSSKSLFTKEDEETNDKKKDNSDDFFHSKIPWDLTFAYSLTYMNDKRDNSYPTNSLMINANIDLTPKWKIGVSSGYDFAKNGVTYTNLRMERDLLSWRMSFNWIPFGTYTSWGFFIGIKSSVLSDLKWQKNKTPDRNIN